MSSRIRPHVPAEPSGSPAKQQKRTKDDEPAAAKCKRSKAATVPEPSPVKAKVVPAKKSSSGASGGGGDNGGGNGSGGDAIPEAVATTLTSSQKARMSAAQDIARQHMAALGIAAPSKKKKAAGASSSAKVPTADMVFEVLSAIGDADQWPTQKRLNVTDSGMPVPGMCLGLVFALGGLGAKTSLIAESYPDLSRFVVAWAAGSLPQTRDGKAFPFSSLQINYNYAAKRHVDGNNIGPSYIQSIGPHTGGALWTADQGVIECRNTW